MLFLSQCSRTKPISVRCQQERFASNKNIGSLVTFYGNQLDHPQHKLARYSLDERKRAFCIVSQYLGVLLVSHAKDRPSRKRKSERSQREAPRGGGWDLREKRARKNLFFSVPTPYPVKSFVLRWCPVLPRFPPRVQRSNKNTRKQGAVNSLAMQWTGRTRPIQGEEIFLVTY